MRAFSEHLPEVLFTVLAVTWHRDTELVGYSNFQQTNGGSCEKLIFQHQEPAATNPDLAAGDYIVTIIRPSALQLLVLCILNTLWRKA